LLYRTGTTTRDREYDIPGIDRRFVKDYFDTTCDNTGLSIDQPFFYTNASVYFVGDARGI